MSGEHLAPSEMTGSSGSLLVADAAVDAIRNK